MFKNIIYILLTSIIFIFYFSVFKYYSSNQNIKDTSLNRENIDQIVNDKIMDLPILINDTDNVIEFNTGYDEEIKNDKPRSFWKLLKSE